jgi:hypothetical protein
MSAVQGLPLQMLIHEAALGITLAQQEDKSLVISSIETGGPADLSGLIRIGDSIVEVDTVDVFRKSVSFALHLLEGEANRPVSLRIVRGESQKQVTVTLIRRGPKLALQSQPAITQPSSSFTLQSAAAVNSNSAYTLDSLRLEAEQAAREKVVREFGERRKADREKIKEEESRIRREVEELRRMVEVGNVETRGCQASVIEAVDNLRARVDVQADLSRTILEQTKAIVSLLQERGIMEAPKSRTAF